MSFHVNGCLFQVVQRKRMIGRNRLNPTFFYGILLEEDTIVKEYLSDPLSKGFISKGFQKDLLRIL